MTEQGRSQVLRFRGGQNTHLGEQDFCFHCMFKKQVFPGTIQFWGGQKNYGGALPSNTPVATGM